MDFVDLFCGAGLVSDALKKAGLRLKLASDNWLLAIRTFSARHGDKCVPCDLLQQWAIPAFLRKNGILSSFRGTIWMSPPCWELSRARGDFPVSESHEMTFDAVADVAEYAPHALIMVENVEGFLSPKHAQARLEMSKRIYKARGQLVDDERMKRCRYTASDMGVPQNRIRMIFAIPPRGRRMPEPCQCKSPAKPSVRKAIGKGFSDPDSWTPEMTKQEKWLFEGMPLGGNWRSTPRARKYAMSKFGGKTPSEGFLYRGKWGDVPPCVIASKRVWLKDGKFIHPGEFRRFTLGEMREFQAIPRDYMFLGTPEERLRQIGNAVPPPMATEAVMTAIEGMR